MTDTQVALEEGFQRYTSNPEHNHMLMDMLEGLPSRPLEWPNLAAKGYQEYEYSGKKLRETPGTHRNGIIHQAQAEIHQGDEFASLTADWQPSGHQEQ